MMLGGVRRFLLCGRAGIGLLTCRRGRGLAGCLMLGGSSPAVEVECSQGGRFRPPAGWSTAVCWAAGIDLLTCSAAAAGGAAGCLPEPGAGAGVLGGSFSPPGRGRGVLDAGVGVHRLRLRSRRRRLFPSRAAAAAVGLVEFGVGRFGRPGADSGGAAVWAGFEVQFFGGCFGGCESVFTRSAGLWGA